MRPDAPRLSVFDIELVDRDAADPRALYPPYEPPTLRRLRAASVALVATRVAMVVWAAVVALDLRGDGARGSAASAWVGALIGVAWLLAGGWWSYHRTGNVHLLKARLPSHTRSILAWVWAPLWVSLMAATLVRVEPNPDFDVRPIIIVGGFVLSMLAPYRLMHRMFKSLVRMPPTATCTTMYLLDTIAFGLLWWRSTSWSTASGDSLSLDRGVVVAAIVALVAGAVLTWHIDREASKAEQTRNLALRTRHDHRIARLCGLDPMDPGTRRALLLARQAAVRHTDGSGATVIDPDPLLEILARELDGGVTADFAARISQLAMRTDGLVVLRQPGDDTGETSLDQQKRRAATAPRLFFAEGLRYLVTGIYVVCAIACLAVVVAFERNDTWTLDIARHALVGGSMVAHVAAAAWAASVARAATRVGGPRVWRLPVVAMLGTAALAAFWIANDGVLSDPTTLLVFVVATLGLELALWRIIVLDELFVFRNADSPLQAWMSIAPSVLGLFLISPMRTPVDVSEPGGRVAFFATLIGLAAAVSGAMAAISMVQLEDGIRASTHTPDDEEREPVAEPAPAAPATPVDVLSVDAIPEPVLALAVQPTVFDDAAVATTAPTRKQAPTRKRPGRSRKPAAARAEVNGRSLPRDVMPRATDEASSELDVATTAPEPEPADVTVTEPVPQPDGGMGGPEVPEAADGADVLAPPRWSRRTRKRPMPDTPASTSTPKSAAQDTVAAEHVDDTAEVAADPDPTTSSPAHVAAEIVVDPLPLARGTRRARTRPASERPSAEVPPADGADRDDPKPLRSAAARPRGGRSVPAAASDSAAVAAAADGGVATPAAPRPRKSSRRAAATTSSAKDAPEVNSGDRSAVAAAADSPTRARRRPAARAGSASTDDDATTTKVETAEASVRPDEVADDAAADAVAADDAAADPPALPKRKRAPRARAETVDTNGVADPAAVVSLGPAAALETAAQLRSWLASQAAGLDTGLDRNGRDDEPATDTVTTPAAAPIEAPDTNGVGEVQTVAAGATPRRSSARSRGTRESSPKPSGSPRSG